MNYDLVYCGNMTRLKRCWLRSILGPIALILYYLLNSIYITLLKQIIYT